MREREQRVKTPTPLLKALMPLFKVKSLVTIAVTGGIVWGFAAGMIPVEQFMQVAVMVFTYYFARKGNE